MDDKEKLQYQDLLERAYKSMVLMSKHNDALIDLVDRSDKLLRRNLEFMEDVPRQYRIAFLYGIFLGISLLDILQSLLEK